jgi:hypothetical protein
MLSSSNGVLANARNLFTQSSNPKLLPFWPYSPCFTRLTSQNLEPQEVLTSCHFHHASLSSRVLDFMSNPKAYYWWLKSSHDGVGKCGILKLVADGGLQLNGGRWDRDLRSQQGTLGEKQGIGENEEDDAKQDTKTYVLCIRVHVDLIESAFVRVDGAFLGGRADSRPRMGSERERLCSQILFTIRAHALPIPWFSVTLSNPPSQPPAARDKQFVHTTIALLTNLALLRGFIVPPAPPPSATSLKAALRGSHA